MGGVVKINDEAWVKFVLGDCLMCDDWKIAYGSRIFGLLLLLFS